MKYLFQNITRVHYVDIEHGLSKYRVYSDLSIEHTTLDDTEGEYWVEVDSDEQLPHTDFYYQLKKAAQSACF